MNKPEKSCVDKHYTKQKKTQPSQNPIKNKNLFKHALFTANQCRDSKFIAKLFKLLFW